MLKKKGADGMAVSFKAGYTSKKLNLFDEEEQEESVLDAESLEKKRKE